MGSFSEDLERSGINKQLKSQRAQIHSLKTTIETQAAEIERLRGALKDIAEATSAEEDAGENLRLDDREGALDFAYWQASEALKESNG